MFLKQPFKSFKLTLESRRLASPLESYAQMKISNFQVGWAITFKLGIFEPNKNTQVRSFFEYFQFHSSEFKTTCLFILYRLIHLAVKGLRRRLPNFEKKFSAEFSLFGKFFIKIA
jgi:hypothetical protein